MVPVQCWPVQQNEHTMTLDQLHYMGLPPMITIAHDQMQTVSPVTMGAIHHTVECLTPGMQKCALTECPNPSYVDENGTVHECCGRTHAVEYEKRQCKHLQFT